MSDLIIEKSVIRVSLKTLAEKSGYDLIFHYENKPSVKILHELPSHTAFELLANCSYRVLKRNQSEIKNQLIINYK